jgi:hypothetical protein
MHQKLPHESLSRTPRISNKPLTPEENFVADVFSYFKSLGTRP